MPVLGTAYPATGRRRPFQQCPCEIFLVCTSQPLRLPAMINRLTDALDFHAQALVLRSQRQQLIAGNIANVDTPGYQARDFDFASALRAARGGGAAGEGIARDILTPGGRPQPTLRFVHPAQTNLDGNSVDMDRERANFMDNALKFDATLRFINGNVRTTLDAMKSPNSP
jgi:flagellar basal-body rod protein FlgB